MRANFTICIGQASGSQAFFVMAHRNSSIVDIRIICDKSQADKTGVALIEGMKRSGYKLLEHSNPRTSRKNRSDVLVYLKFEEET